MSNLSLETLSTKTESQTFDRKSIKIAAKDLAVTVVAFANADGGTIAIGIADDGRLEGIDGHQEHLNELLRVPFDFCQPSVKISTDKLPFVRENGTTDHVLLMNVEQSSKVHANQKDEVYYRVGDKSKKLTFDERLQLLYDKGEMIYENKSVFGASIDDIDLQLVQSYCDLIGYTKSPLEYLEQNDKLIVTDEDKYKISTAAVLLFGKRPQDFFPRAQVRFIKYQGTEALTGAQMNVMKDVIFDGTILDMVNKSINFVSTQIREHTYLGKDARFVTKPEYPEFVWKELIINAITHRDYSILGTDIQIKMFDDRISVESPGNLPSIVRLDNMRYVHFSRNPIIAKFLKAHKFVREFGEGVDRMYRELAEAGNPVPKYEQIAFMIVGTAYSLLHENAENINIAHENPTENYLQKITKKNPKDINNNPPVNPPVNSLDGQIVQLMLDNTRITYNELAKITGKHRDTIREHVGKMQKEGIITRIGPDKGGYWQVTQTINPSVNPSVNSLDDQIVRLILENPQITYNKLSKITGKHRDTIREHLGKMQTEGLLTRIGPDKGGYWKVNERMGKND